MSRVCLLYCLSGFVSLGYQVAWFRIFVDRFGSTNLTFGLVVSNFIGGLGVGSLASKRFCRRLEGTSGLKSRVRLYGLIEILVGATALVTLLLPWVPADVWGAFPYELREGVFQPSFLYQLSHVAVTVICVFIPCFFMGTTFPLLCRAFGEDGRFPATVYGWNTLGACAGVLACEFLLLPAIGHELTFAVMVLVNLGLGTCFLLGRRFADRLANRKGRAQERVAAATPSAAYPMSVAVTCAVVAGLLTGAFEADALRRLQFMDCRTGAALSCISFWAILAIFAASWTVRAFPELRTGHIKVAYVVALVIHGVLWISAYRVRDWASAGDLAALKDSLPKDTTGLGVRYDIFYFRYGLGAILKFTGAFVFPAFYLLSLLLPHVCNAVQREQRHLGVVYGANTVAFCGGLLAFTVAAPVVSVFYSLKLFLVLFACWRRLRSSPATTRASSTIHASGCSTMTAAGSSTSATRRTIWSPASLRHPCSRACTGSTRWSTTGLCGRT